MSDTQNHDDKLEVRRNDGGRFQVYDLLGEQFVGHGHTREQDAQRELDARRADHRPLIVRWIYGVPTATSKAQGILS